MCWIKPDPGKSQGQHINNVLPGALVDPKAHQQGFVQEMDMHLSTAVDTRNSPMIWKDEGEPCCCGTGEALGAYRGAVHALPLGHSPGAAVVQPCQGQGGRQRPGPHRTHPTGHCTPRYTHTTPVWTWLVFSCPHSTVEKNYSSLSAFMINLQMLLQGRGSLCCCCMVLACKAALLPSVARDLFSICLSIFNI